MDSMSAADARAFSEAMATERPPGPEVGEIVDGTLPGAGGRADLPPVPSASDGPHPVVVYFHGGGWVLGSHESDDPFCRDLCVRTDAVVVSVDYRHAPEARFPAAADDAFAALRWVADHAGRTRWRPGPARRGRLERRRQPRGGRVPAGPRRRRPAIAGPAAGHARHRRRSRRAVVPRERRGLHADRRR